MAAGPAAGDVPAVAIPAVMIESPGENAGAGIAIAPGLILTALHVVEIYAEVAVVDSYGVERSGRVIWWDFDADLAVIRIDNELAPAIATAFLRCSPPRFGEQVMAIGQTADVHFLAKWGRVSSMWAIDYSIWTGVVVVSFTASPGMSGAGVVALDTGEVVGIMVGRLVTTSPAQEPETAPYGFMVPGDKICRLLEAAGFTGRTGGLGQP